MTLDEDFVRASFGNAFTNEMKKMNRGFVDIPVGDYKASRLMDYPTLQSNMHVSLKYVQSEGKDLCVSKSLASVFSALGWHEESAKIDHFGEEILKGMTMQALEKVVDYSRTLFPKRLITTRIKPSFNWKVDLLPKDVFVGVLQASDDSCSHAVSIHGNLVYDANETVAISLCDEALDYCASSATVKSTFVKFKRGYIYRNHSQRKSRILKMTLNTDVN